MSAADPPPSPTFEVVDDLPGEFAERVVEAYHYRAAERFGMALSSGDVAQHCYERLAQHAEAQIDWWLVELWVPEVDLARQALLNRVGAAYAVHSLPASAPGSASSAGELGKSDAVCPSTPNPRWIRSMRPSSPMRSW